MRAGIGLGHGRYTSTTDTDDTQVKLLILHLNPFLHLVGLELGAVKVNGLALAGLATILLARASLDLGVGLLAEQSMIRKDQQRD